MALEARYTDLMTNDETPLATATAIAKYENEIDDLLLAWTGGHIDLDRADVDDIDVDLLVEMMSGTVPAHAAEKVLKHIGWVSDDPEWSWDFV